MPFRRIRSVQAGILAFSLSYPVRDFSACIGRAYLRGIIFVSSEVVLVSRIKSNPRL